MNIHELKTDPIVFALTVTDVKRYEIRVNDRDFQLCDELHLKETEFSGEEMKAGKPLIYTGRMAVRRIDHILSGYGLTDGWVVLSVTKI